MKRIKLANALLIAGPVICIGAIIYAVVYVNIPYQDATPAQYAAERFHTAVATWGLLLGFLSVVLGIGLWVRRWIIHR